MKFNRRKALIFNICLFVIALSSFVFSKDISGTVSGLGADNKPAPLVKASVHWIGTSIGAITDKSGKFQIASTNKSNKLEVSYIGYKKDTLEVSDYSKPIDVVLKADLTLDAITVNAVQPSRLLSNSTIKTESTTLRGLQKAACCNLSESFQTNPSVDVSFTNAVTGAKQIQLLGLQGVYIQALNEQVPSMRGLSANLGLEYVPGPWMESIQISKGLASVVTGFESISGQMNIEFKKPEHEIPLFFNAYINNIGRGEVNLTSAIKLSDNVSTMIFGHTSFNQVKVDDNADSFIDKPLSKQFNFMNRWDIWDGIWESRTIIKGLYDERNGGQSEYWPNKNNTFYGMQMKSQKFEFITKNGFIFPEASYSSIGTIVSLTHYKVDSYFDKVLYNGEENSLYARVMYQSQLFDSTHKYMIGLSYTSDNFIENLQSLGKTQLKYSPKLESIPGAFIEYTYSGIQDLTLMAGFRADFPNKFARFLTPRFHAQYRFDENNAIRASVGKGYRIANIHAEDIGIFASSRKLFMDGKQSPEEAWNYGMNASTLIPLFGIDFTVNAEFYRTEFKNQIIVDMEQKQTEMHIYNLKGQSYSNSFQIDVSAEPINGFIITTAYRLNDVKMTINGSLVDKPLQSRQKGFLNLAYSTFGDEWTFDFTAEYNGSGRLLSLGFLDTSISKDPSNWIGNSPSFMLYHAQITKKFKNFDIYLGGENLSNYTQKEVILSPDNPRGPYFDGALVWGPVIGRIIYLGIRLSIN
jgi:outer membrane receptor for ferrienterochelin and colicins